MAKPLTTERANARGGDLVASAVRTLELAASGISTLSHAIHDGLGRAFIDAVELVSRARGRVIVTGMGKSGARSRRRSPRPARPPSSCIRAKRATAISA